MRSANNSYFPMMGTPMLRGRNFNNTDVANGPLVAIITSQLAHDLYGDKDPVGQLISSCIDGKPSAPAWRTVVGVVGDTRARGRTTEPPRELYMPSAQWQGNSTMAFLMRGAVPVTTLLPRFAARCRSRSHCSRFPGPHHDGRGVRRASGASAIHDVAARPARRDRTRVGDRRRLRGHRILRVAAYARIRRANGARSAGPALLWMVVKEEWCWASSASPSERWPRTE